VVAALPSSSMAHGASDMPHMGYGRVGLHTTAAGEDEH
jgi:hypothetical protein